jgi:hypothetical protein
MKRILGLVAVVILLAVGYFYFDWQRKATLLAGAKEVEEATYTKDGKVANIRYVGIIDAPLDKVQDTVWAVERSSQMIENIKKSELTKQEGNTKTMLMQLKAGNLPLQQYTMEFTYHPEQHRIDFKSLQAQAADLEGSYSLEAVGTKTRITYAAKSTDKIAVPFPDGVIETANREVFVNMVRGIGKALNPGQQPPAG